MQIAWGKPKIWAAKLTDGTAGEWIELPTPAEGTTTLTPTKGDKKEAKIEGGENEAVKYNRNTYVLEFSIRLGSDREKPFEDEDGVIPGEYAIMLQPEDPTVEGLKIDKCVISLEDSYSAEEGIMLKYSADVLKPATGNQVKYEVITDPTNEG